MNKNCIGVLVISVSLSIIGHAQTLSITNGLTLHFEADAGVFGDAAGTIAATNGGAVALWKDEVGNITGGDAKNTLTNRQPIYVTGVINGLPVVRFDGTDDVLRNSALASGYLTASAWTTFEVFRALSVDGTDPSGYASDAVFEDSNGYWGLSMRTAAGTPKLMAYSYPNVAEKTFASNQFTFATSSLSGGFLSLQSASAGSGNPGTTNTVAAGNTDTADANGGLNVGSSWNGCTGCTLNGDIAEILIFNRPLNTQEKDSVTAYLNDKYALGILPATIPEPSSLVLLTIAMCAILRRKSDRA